jgi:hypothetical protein
LIRYRRTYEKILKWVDDGNGYQHLTLSKNGKGINFQVHRLVAQAFIPNPNNLPFVCHKDDDPYNNSVDNLFWGTHQDNTDDKVNKNRQAKGFIIAGKLKVEDVLSIRKKYTGKKGEISRISEEFDIDKTTAYRIVQKKTWKHI